VTATKAGQNSGMNKAANSLRTVALAGLAILGPLVVAPVAVAALGEADSRLDGDAVALRATLTRQPRDFYTVHELVTPEGTRVREFAVPGGAVFAVSWAGPFRPDLRPLLGAQYAGYQAAPRLPGSTRTQMAIDHQGLRVRSGGHMHAFRGIAWLPALLPAGVDPGALQ
jgi:hypothetical protein